MTDSEYRAECDDYMQDYTYLWILTCVCMLSISFINVVLKYALQGRYIIMLYYTIYIYIYIQYIALGKYERYATQTQESISIMHKLFIACFINMAILILFINFDLSDSNLVGYFHKNIPLMSYILNGDYDDFTRIWYLKVGLSFSIILSINVLFPHILSLVLFKPIILIRRACCWKGKILQMDLNTLFEGPCLDIPYRYALLIANIFLAFAFSSGIPLLTLLLILQIFLLYWIDKSLCKYIYIYIYISVQPL